MSERAELATRALRRAILGTLLLGLAKGAAALYTGSNAVGASAADALTDAIVSGANLMMVRAAAAPPDEEHPFGHGKAEGLAGLAQAIFLSLVVIGVARSAILRITGEAPLPEVGPAIVVMLGSMVGSWLLSRGLRRAAERTGSVVLKADAVHYRMDLLTGIAVVIGLAATWVTQDGRADAIASLVLCAWMAKEIAPIAWEAVHELMDRPFAPSERAEVERVLAGFQSRILGYHDLRTRRSGPHRFVQVHVVLPADMTLREAHRVADDLEAALIEALPECDPIVHLDPDGEADRGAAPLRSSASP